MTKAEKPPAKAASGGSNVTTKDLVEALSAITKKGLPATLTSAGNLLTRLRSVMARATHPDDPMSRLDALNELLPRLIDQLTDEKYRKATHILFGLATGTRRTTLTTRRRQAADLLGYNIDHFRNEIEPEMLRGVVDVMMRDLRRYRSRVKRSVQSMEVTGDTPKLTEADLTAEEELISRIWQHVYGLRAELIAFGRLSEQAGYEAQAEDYRQAAMRMEDALRALIAEYVKTYGELIRHGEAEYAAETLERLAGWRI